MSHTVGVAGRREGPEVNEYAASQQPNVQRDVAWFRHARDVPRR